MNTLYYEMQKISMQEKVQPPIISRFERWMRINATNLLEQKKTMNFETCSPENKAILDEYLKLWCKEFDFKWYGVNYSVDISLQGYFCEYKILA